MTAELTIRVADLHTDNAISLDTIDTIHAILLVSHDLAQCKCGVIGVAGCETTR